MRKNARVKFIGYRRGSDNAPVEYKLGGRVLEQNTEGKIVSGNFNGRLCALVIFQGWRRPVPVPKDSLRLVP